MPHATHARHGGRPAPRTAERPRFAPAGP